MPIRFFGDVWNNWMRQAYRVIRLLSRRSGQRKTAILTFLVLSSQLPRPDNTEFKIQFEAMLRKFEDRNLAKLISDLYLDEVADGLDGWQFYKALKGDERFSGLERSEIIATFMATLPR